jgi:hypothetical protein
MSNVMTGPNAFPAYGSEQSERRKRMRPPPPKSTIADWTSAVKKTITPQITRSAFKTPS